MGAHPPGRGTGEGGPRPIEQSRFVDVHVDSGVRGLDRPFTYSVPDKLRDRARIGSIVRVPMRARKMRGWITSFTDASSVQGTISPITAVSGPAPVFDEALLGVARELARRSVAPLASYLSLFTPVQVSRGAAAFEPVPMRDAHDAPFKRLLRLGAHQDPLDVYRPLISEQLARGEGAIVAVPEVLEGSRIIDGLRESFGDDVAVVHSGQEPKDRAAACWQLARGDRKVAVGGRAALLVPAFPTGLIIVHHEHDLSFKEQRSPYYDAREVALLRARAANASILLTSPTPALETWYSSLEGGPDSLTYQEPVRAVERAGWPIVEVVAPPKIGMARRAIAVILQTRAQGGRSLVLVPRSRSSRGGAGVEQVAHFISRVVPDLTVTSLDRDTLGASGGGLRPALSSDVIVATEVVLADIERPEIQAAIALDVDSFIRRPSGRAVERSFQLLWMLAGMVSEPGSGQRGRLILETDSADHRIVQALTRGDYNFFAKQELQIRREEDAPPFVRLVRVKGPAEHTPPNIEEALGHLPGAQVLGPIEDEKGWEFLIKAKDIGPVIDGLGTIVKRDPARILIETDPRDW